MFFFVRGGGEESMGEQESVSKRVRYAPTFKIYTSVQACPFSPIPPIM